MPEFLAEGKDRIGDPVYLAKTSGDIFVHFTTRERAEQILASNRLMLNPPHHGFGIMAVCAVSTDFGRFLPSVQTTHLKEDPSNLVGVVFTTNTPADIGYPEEVIWHGDVAFDDVMVVSYEEAVQMLSGDKDVPDEFNVYYRQEDFDERVVPSTPKESWVIRNCKFASDLQQQFFPFYEPSEYKPVTEEKWPVAEEKPMEALQEVIVDFPGEVKVFLDANDNVYDPTVVSFDDAGSKDKADPVIVVTIAGALYVLDSLDSVEPDLTEASEWVYAIPEYALGQYVGYRDFNAEFWESADGVVMYHATDPDNVQYIMKEGLDPKSESRAMSNRMMGSAVFTGSMPELLSSYGDAVIEINVGAMKKDGYTPRVSQEEPFEESEIRSTLAHKLGIEEFWGSEEYASEGLSEDTVAFFATIPPKYLKVSEDYGRAFAWVMKNCKFSMLNKTASVTFVPSGSYKIAKPKDCLTIARDLYEFGLEKGILSQSMGIGYDEIDPDGTDFENPTGIINFYIPKQKRVSVGTYQDEGKEYERYEWIDIPMDDRVSRNDIERLVDSFNESSQGVIEMRLGQIEPSKSRDMPVARINVVKNETQKYESIPEINMANANASMVLKMLAEFGLPVDPGDLTGEFSIDDYWTARHLLTEDAKKERERPQREVKGPAALEELQKILDPGYRPVDLDEQEEQQPQDKGPKLIDQGMTLERIERYLTGLDRIAEWVNTNKLPDRNITFS